LPGLAALLDFAEAVVQRVDQQLAPLRVVDQVVFEVGVALHDPDVAQHLVEHPGGAAGAALATQAVEQFPGPCAQQPDHDFAVRERGVVVRNLAQASFGVGRVQGGTGHLEERIQGKRCVHVAAKQQRARRAQSPPCYRSGHFSPRTSALAR